jgi:ubiquitin C-terminal hydrolase
MSYSTLDKAPSILIFGINRFQGCPQKKLNVKVEMPKLFEADTYLSASANSKKRGLKGKVIYDLYAYIVHTGHNSNTQGHYFSVINTD